MDLKEIFKEPEKNFEWAIGVDTVFHFYVKRNLHNRFKWYVSTKLFLPGTYKWLTK